MNAAEQYLAALGRALSALTLYQPGHRAREVAIARLWERLELLLGAMPNPAFSLLDDAVICGATLLPALGAWPWSARLAQVGIRRIEFTRDATPQSQEEFLYRLHERLASGMTPPEPTLQLPGIRAGMMSVQGVAPASTAEQPGAIMPFRFREEVDAVEGAFARARAGGALPVHELEAVVRSLSVAMHREGELLIPLLALKRVEDYAALHAVNVSVLAMTFGESLGLSAGDIRAIGRVALLHDIGMTRIPRDVLEKGPLTANERELVSRHPLDGAKFLLANPEGLDLAATAAYEHHLRVDGTGYPARRFRRDQHYVSRVIAVCDAYDALRTLRSYRPAWDPPSALRLLEQGAGTAFDPGVAAAFVALLRRLEGRVVPASAE